MRKQVETLEHHPDFPTYLVDPFDVIGQLHSIDHNRPALMFLQPIDAPNQSRFAGAGRTANYDALSALNCQVDVAQRVKDPVPFVNAGKSDCGVIASVGVDLRPLARLRST